MPIPNIDGIRSYGLFGESQHLSDLLHCETIAERSALYDWELAPHRHARLHQLLLIESGGGLAQLDGERQTLFAGALVNVPPAHVHAFRFQPQTEGWVTTLADELLDELFVRAGDLRRELGRPCILAADDAARRAMREIWQEFCGRDTGRALVLRGLSATLLGRLARAVAQERSATTPAPPSVLLQRLDALIEARFLEHWQVADYARALCVSPTHLSRVARAGAGVSALRLIEARLMREARRKLAYTQSSVSAIAYALGYADPAHFSRAFTRDAGLSPRSFRAQLSVAVAGPGRSARAARQR